MNSPCLLGQDQLPGQVKQQIRHLFADGGRITLRDGMVQLEHLLEQVRTDGLAGLDPVPGAALAEIPDHRQSASKR